MPVTVGSRAPEFELPAAPGEDPVRLSDLRLEGPVVLLFIPLAFSSTCTEEMCTVAGEWALWEELNARVLGISVDSPFVTSRFARECGAPFPILSDFNRTATEAYGVRNDDFYGLEGVAHRSAFVIDRSGTVVYAWCSEDASRLPPFDEVEDAVRRAG